MKRELYHRRISDGINLIVTKERNGYALFRIDDEGSTNCLWFYSREEALETALHLVFKDEPRLESNDKA